jgi:hypothetical protein
MFGWPYVRIYTGDLRYVRSPSAATSVSDVLRIDATIDDTWTTPGDADEETASQSAVPFGIQNFLNRVLVEWVTKSDLRRRPLMVVFDPGQGSRRRFDRAAIHFVTFP